MRSNPHPPERPSVSPGPNASPAAAHPAILWQPEVDGAVRCVACAHRCLIRPGRAGICQVRQNADGKLVTSVYGRAVSANADPIEKKPLFHFYPGSVAFSIATRGCNFHCLHCQNWTISQAARDGLEVPDFALPPDRRRQAAPGRGFAQHRLHVHRADDLHRVRRSTRRAWPPKPVWPTSW